MNNLEKMKADVISQINAMDIHQFECFIEMLRGEVLEEEIFDLSNIFQCKDCRKIYGDCSENEEGVCAKRFKIYALTDNT